jgi:hypothetical protein
MGWICCTRVVLVSLLVMHPVQLWHLPGSLCNFLRQFRASFSKRRAITFGSTPDLQPEHHESEVGGQMQRCVNASESMAARALARFRKAAAKYWDVTACKMNWWIVNLLASPFSSSNLGQHRMPLNTDHAIYDNSSPSRRSI